MASITTPVVKKVKVNGVYQVSNEDLHINTNHGFKHDVIVCSINEKRKTARVKTITSLERNIIDSQGIKRKTFNNSKLNEVRSGNILPIPRKQLKSRHYSGINHNAKIVPLKKIHYKNANDRTIFPKRYANLIKRK